MGDNAIRLCERRPLRGQTERLDGHGCDPDACQSTGDEAQSLSGAAAHDDVARSGPNSPGAGEILGERTAKLRPTMRVGVAERLDTVPLPTRA